MRSNAEILKDRRRLIDEPELRVFARERLWPEVQSFKRFRMTSYAFGIAAALRFVDEHPRVFHPGTQFVLAPGTSSLGFLECAAITGGLAVANLMHINWRLPRVIAAYDKDNPQPVAMDFVEPDENWSKSLAQMEHWESVKFMLSAENQPEAQRPLPQIWATRELREHWESAQAMLAS